MELVGGDTNFSAQSVFETIREAITCFMLSFLGISTDRLRSGKDCA
jgi:hypothetical protein